MRLLPRSESFEFDFELTNIGHGRELERSPDRELTQHAAMRMICLQLRRRRTTVETSTWTRYTPESARGIYMYQPSSHAAELCKEAQLKHVSA
jgi:hypothetical protein